MRKKLKEIAVVSSGQSAPQGSNVYSDNGIPFVKAGNLHELLNGKDISKIQKVSNDIAKKYRLKLFKKGTILFAKSGMSCLKGYVYILPCDAYVVNHLACVTPKEDISDYLCYLFNFHKPNQLIKDSAYPSISLSDISNISVNLVEDSVRLHRIRILDGLHKIIFAQKKELLLLDKLIKARFVEMFGDPETNSKEWTEAKIGDNCFVTKLAGFEYTKYIHYKDYGDVVMVKAQNVKNGALNQKELSYISNAVSDSLPRSQLAPGDIVMTYVGANIGDVAIIDDKYKYHLAPNVAKIRPDKNFYDSTFFMYMLMMKTNYIMRNSADTAKAALGMERIRKLKVFVPEFELQKEFASFVTQIDKSKVAVQKSLEQTQLLFDSLMQEYFG